ncbi:hypothetical protein SDRG_09603 [Saprolegnia diclina VS20]|uniref:Wings apart-like protein C-terminal domain-containing protein n=1 Tax=Saprolegnia diclina (strain VS20) TaxID=1156394 RepID=T0Q5G1_SAPDV|nr:hypothetical protein SDRG_09603 [Saprolegnia diclina VS20]EQC33084.1 hypothetical protein SDRG_09603 [Saprolegnia diclina VS20]|eukprot:XP_008613770.1 hypothetical protein SDRG_09603 [Saprolegnia diclina VS20]
MQTTAHLQHHGGSATAGEQVEYLLQGLEEGGSDASRAMSAYTLATMCSSHFAPGPAVNGAMTGRFLLRAQGGLTDCICLVETLAPESRDHALVYCMMGFLYFVTLDRENADAVTTDALRTVLHVLQLDDAKHWTLLADVTPSPTAATTPRARMLVKKKKTATTKRTSTTPSDDMQALLRLEPSFRASPNLSLYDIVLGILYNTLLDKAAGHFGAAAPTASSRIIESRKQLLREAHGLDIIARRNLSSISLRVLDQASYLDPLNQAHLVAHTTVLPALFTDLLAASPTTENAEVYLYALRVVINLTHKNDDACAIIANLHGARTLARTFCSVAPRSDFDQVLLLVSALVNCVELDARNRADVWSYPMHLVDHCMAFLTQHGTESAEDVVLRGSMALLLGCLVRDRPTDAKAVRDALPNQSFTLLLASLLAFAKLHAHIGALTPEILATCVQVETELKRVEGDETATSAIQAAVAGPDADVAAIYAKIAAASPPPCASPPQRPPRPSPACQLTPPADAFRLQVHRLQVDDESDDDDLSTRTNKRRRTPKVPANGARRPTPSPTSAMLLDTQSDTGDFTVTELGSRRKRQPVSKRRSRTPTTTVRTPIASSDSSKKQRTSSVLERKARPKKAQPQCLLTVFDFDE